MFKGVLCLVIIFACGGLGLLKAQSYSQRLNELKDLKEMIQILRTEMSYLKDPLPAVFARVGSYKDNRAMNLLWECGQLMKTKLELNECWRQAVDAAYSGSCLLEEDRGLLLDLGLQLGKSDLRGQASMFSLTEARLNAQMEQAQKEKDTKGRMYRGLGFSIGVVIAVILI